MTALSSSQALFEAERQVFLEKPADANAVGDIEGTVIAEWVKLSSTGRGIVKYKNKEYTTIPLGSRSIVRGNSISLSFGRGVYFSNW